MKILHLADIHAKDSQIPEVKKCLDFIIETARQEEPDLVVVAGDTFDSRGVKMESDSAQLIFDSFSALADIAPMLVLAGTKSHEGGSVEVLKHIGANHPVCVSSHPEQIYLCEGMFARTAADIEAFGRVDAVLSTLPTPTKQYFITEANIADSDKEIANALSALFAGFGASAHEFDALHALVFHCAIGGAFISDTQVLIGREIEISPDQIALANADVAMGGHIHYAQEIKPHHIFYSGSITRVTYGETEPKGFYIHDFSCGELDSRPEYFESRFIETPARKLIRNINDFTDGPIELDAALYALDPEDVKDSLVRVEFTTWQDEAEQLDREKIKQFYMSAGAQDVDVRIIRKPRENIRSEKLLKLTTLRDKIKERAALNGEEVGESVLLKADELEAMEPDEIVQGVI